ncbi:MAG: hypothetical protein A3F84_14015 [Candidatus Handelsmanbacteria bacterium RIFCSPLOWO2_12_FULL_64_10]|uniref:Fibronectin type-III domain-containing protein n=1 Tax=Handelsmanbacteria sp. (strain RIFCSPLOWO2_12_FULL_64_10) TaxID=1817868 RepID=A0A1F6CDK3_HANXR|nr:MAG: hypothetical protein A3F84_14015 [Candidatus Handelsmanbacteria bacterium RIFCSPLOWO2_12_FULL_64_10]
MRNLTFIILALLLVASGAFGQAWETAQTLTGVWSASAAFGDYTGDGLPDLVLTGQTGAADGGVRIARAYRNVNGTLTEDRAQALTGVAYGAVAWADYDRDGDLDLALSGLDASNQDVLKLYKNDRGTLREDTDQTEFLPVRYTALAWGDYDDDGDADLAVSGMDALGAPQTVLYRNDNGRFALDAGNSDILVNVAQGALAWGDYDNDGDADLALTGIGTNGVRFARIYKNQPLGALSFDTGTELKPLSGGSITWADYDDDGDADLFTSGWDATWNARFIVYHNRPTGTLREATVNFTRLLGPTAWGDYDNEGHIDALGGGQPSLSDAFAFFLRNAPPGALAEDRSASLPGLRGGALALSDIDADGDLDLLTAGEDEAGRRQTSLLRNGRAPLPNQPPTPPDHLDPPLVTGTKATFTWGQGKDDRTEPDDLTYDLQVGNSLGADRVFSGVAATTLGNVGHRTNKTLTLPLPEGQYTWRVRAVDNAFQRSTWSQEGAFLVQTFVASDQGIHNLTRASAAWGDPDNDGDADLTVAGQDVDGETRTILYENRNGLLTENVRARFVGVRDGDLAWADYDNDGDLDLTVVGEDRFGNAYGRVYRNDRGTFVLDTATATTLPRLTNSRVAWGDYEGDGDLDLAIMGRDPAVGGFTAKLYRNEGKGVLREDTSQKLPEVASGRLTWGDYNNDGVPDLLIAGQLPDGGGLARIYRNDPPGTLKEDAAARLEGVRASSAAWGDYDNDGDLDLALCGFSADRNQRVTLLYENTGGAFRQAFSLTGVQGGALAWGDYDNDGDPDLVVAGNGADGPFVQVYRNNRTSFDPEPYRVLRGVDFSAAAWADVGGDGDLDLTTLGRGSDLSPRSGINDNLTERVLPNRRPDAPRGLTSQTDGGSVTLRWNAGQDLNGTPAAGLTYTLRVGASAGGHEVMSGVAPVGMGNVGEGRVRVLRNLPSNFYTWSVRTLDAGFGASDFAPEERFIIDTIKPVVRSVDVQPKVVGLNQDVTVVVTFFDDFSGLNTDTLPEVSFLPARASAPTTLRPVGFTGATPTFVWTGRATIPTGVSSGAATISVSGAVDRKGNRLDAAPGAGTFQIDADPPRVVTSEPAAGQTAVPRSSPIRVVFNETMDAATLTREAFQVTTGGATVAGTFNYDPNNRTVIFQPGELKSKTTYEVTLFSSVRDSVGNRMPQDFRFTFQTADVLVAQDGGTIRTADGLAALYAPPRALAQDQEITLVPLSAAEARPPASLTFISAYRIGPDAPLSLAKPSTLTLAFRALPAGVRAERLTIFRRDGNSWTRVGGSYDDAAKSISTVVGQLGVFGLLEDPSGGAGAGLTALDCQPRVFSPGGGGFRETTDISFSLAGASPVTIHIYSRGGRLERVLKKDAPLNPGVNVVPWDGKDDDGQFVPSGLYIVVLTAEGKKLNRTVAVMRN